MSAAVATPAHAGSAGGVEATPVAPPAGTLTGDPLAGRLDALLASYRPRVPRQDLHSVERLLDAADPPRVPHHIAVVGSSGKTSTATFLGRLLAPDACVGVFTSPHLARWTERCVIDGVPIDDGTLLAAIERIHRVAHTDGGRDPKLRFFDVLTVAAEEVFASAGVEVAVFEAGIGGRRDPVRVLEPEIVGLTGVDLEHTELLGETREEIVREKVAIAGEQALVVASELNPGVRAAADEELSRARAALSIAAPDDVPLGFHGRQRENVALALALAEAAVARFSIQSGAGGPRARLGLIDPAVPGRYDLGTAGTARYVADVAHNPAAWDELLAQLAEREQGGGHVAVVTLSHGRPVEGLAERLVRSGLFEWVIATSSLLRPGHHAALLADAIRRVGVRCEHRQDPGSAFARALELAESEGRTLVVFGSTYLVAEFLQWTRGT